MPPTFKKPQEYDPSLAEKTLAKVYERSEAAQRIKQQHMLAELGLADEAGIDINDEDEDLDDEEYEQEAPVFSNNSHNHTAANGRLTNGSNGTAPAVYGYRDVFSKEWQRRRQQDIERKGYERYLSEMLGRANESLQVLRCERALSDPTCVEVIGEMEHELTALHQENKALRQQVEHHGASTNGGLSKTGSGRASAGMDAGTTAVLEQYEEDIRRLQARVSQLEASLSARDAAVQQLQQQLEDAQQQLEESQEQAAEATAAAAAAAASTGAADAAGASRGADDSAEISELHAMVSELQRLLASKEAAVNSLQAQLREVAHESSSSNLGASGAAAAAAAQVEALQAALSVKESALAAAQREVQDLKTGGAKSGGQRAAEAQEAVAEAQHRATALQERCDTLEAQVKAAREEGARAEAEYSGRLQEMSQAAEHRQAAELQKQVWSLTEQHTARVEELQAEIKTLTGQLSALKADAAKSADATSAKLKQARESVAAEFRLQLDALYKVVDDLHASREGVMAELVSLKKDIFSDKMQQQMVRMVRDREVNAVRKARQETRTAVEAAEKRAAETQEEMAALQERCDQALRIKELESQGAIAFFKDKWRMEFEKRKKLHNQVLELKGNIRVLCRVRPMLEKEKRASGCGDGGDAPVRPLTEECVRVVSDKGDKEFEFDRVFGPDEGQEKVFDEVSGLVTSVLDGYNVCIMAYGQTGSGKTFTMEGPESDPGVYLRALKELFRLAEERSTDFEVKFSASVLEIYNEQIYDLLSGSKDQDDKLDVKQGPEGMYVPGLTLESVRSSEDVAGLISKGKRNRSTFSTNMNEHSSRSHLVLSVHVTSTAKAPPGSTLRGKLHLIDLAGSERISRTGAQGDRLKEAQAINKSLSSLGDVIQALQQRNAHIPYRNSKLTRLLEDSLGSSAKCVLVVNVSPAGENVGETKCSLEFASRARKVELGRARQNVAGDGSATPMSTPKPPRYGGTGAATPGGYSTAGGGATPEAGVSRSSSIKEFSTAGATARKGVRG